MRRCRETKRKRSTSINADRPLSGKSSGADPTQNPSVATGFLHIVRPAATQILKGGYEEKQKELVNEFCRQLRKIKTDILEITTEYKSDVKYHNWINEIKKTITPNKDKYQKDNLYYDEPYIPTTRKIEILEEEKIKEVVQMMGYSLN